MNTAFRNLIHDLIRTNNYEVDVCKLPSWDRQLLLSHFLQPSDYEWALENPTRLEATFLECYEEIQFLIDREVDSVYADDMYERGMICLHHTDNGEAFWVRR